MSIEAVNQFLEKVAQDNQLQEKLANSKGYQFTGEELMAEVEKRQKAAINSGELSEEELESVAGGTLFPTVIRTVPNISPAMPTVITPEPIFNIKW